MVNILSHSNKDCRNLYQSRSSINIVMMFALLFTVLVTLLPNTEFNMSSDMSDLRKTLHSFTFPPEGLNITPFTLPPPPPLEDKKLHPIPLSFLTGP